MATALGTVCGVVLFLSACLQSSYAFQVQASSWESVLGKHSPPSSTGRVLSQTFRTPPFTLQPGGVSIKTSKYDFPPGHILLRDLKSELVRDDDSPVPLTDVYLHHWVLQRYRQDVNKTVADASPPLLAMAPRTLEVIPGLTPIPNAGVCQHGALSHWLGAGGEVRRTDGAFPSPYGIEIANPALLNGQEEVWYGQVHALDLRGAVDPWGCTECNCELYNQTARVAKLAKMGARIPADYAGGLVCCPNGVVCRQKEGFNGEPRTYRLKYTVEYVPFDECSVPLKVYQLDVTDTGERSESFFDGCKVEYPVEACDPHGPLAACVDTRESRVRIPGGGDLIYAVGHMHAGGTILSISREGNGAPLCESVPRYGQTAAPGDEAGYVTGMGSCRFKAGEATIAPNETLVVRSSYSRLGGHTGVMGLFFLGVAEDADQRRVLANERCAPAAPGNGEERGRWSGVSMWHIVAAFAAGAILVALVAGVSFRYWKARNADSEYRPIDSAWPNA